MLTLMIIFLAYRFRLRLRHPQLIAGLLLILATVYLHYHYFVDVVAGAVAAFLCLAPSKKLYSGLESTSDTP